MSIVPTIKEDPGSAFTDVCPRGGYIWLTHKTGERVAMPTRCKTYGCKGCRDQIFALFRGIVSKGCSIIGPCVFITFTYRMAGNQSLRDAVSVAKDWRALRRQWKSTSFRLNKLPWLRVVELTKKGQIHLHLIMQSPGGQIRCYGNSFAIAPYRERMATCQCLSHELARQWRAITGDSYIVHTTPVVGANGAAGYLGGYLEKGGASIEELRARGFKRRWSKSRNWPAGDRMRLEATVKKEWVRVEWNAGIIGQYLHELAEEEENPLLNRVGTPVAMKASLKAKAKRVYRKMVKYATLPP